VKIFDIIESSGNMHGRDIDWEQEIRDDIMTRGGQVHPYYQGLGISQAAQKAKEFYNSGRTSQGKAVKNALVFFGYDPDKMPSSSNNTPKTDTKFEPRKSYELPTTSSTPARSAHGGMGNNNAAKQSSKPKARGVAGGIAHGAHHLKDIERTDRSRKSKQAAKRT
jgi:hypothetical protein|tara:strand:- start:234 stop:728 length:495 start_codon:yes stop_codon:yes gene_type:complete